MQTHSGRSVTVRHMARTGTGKTTNQSGDSEPARAGGEKRSTVLVRDTLRRLASGELQPGSRIPTEVELCEQYSMSRSAVRDGMQTLAGKGMITSQQGRGTEVAPRENWQMLDPEFLTFRLGDDRFHYLFELREFLEPLIARLAAERATDDDLRSLRRTLRRQQDATDDDDAQAFAEHDLAFHQGIAIASQNPLLVAVYEAITSLGRELRVASVDVPGAMGRAVEWHTTVLDQIAGHDPDQAAVMMTEHMSQARGELDAALVLHRAGGRA